MHATSHLALRPCTRRSLQSWPDARGAPRAERCGQPVRAELPSALQPMPGGNSRIRSRTLPLRGIRRRAPSHHRVSREPRRMLRHLPALSIVVHHGHFVDTREGAGQEWGRGGVTRSGSAMVLPFASIPERLERRSGNARFHAQSRPVAHDRDDHGIHGIQEVEGSTPFGSTSPFARPDGDLALAQLHHRVGRFRRRPWFIEALCGFS